MIIILIYNYYGISENILKLNPSLGWITGFYCGSGLFPFFIYKCLLISLLLIENYSGIINFFIFTSAFLIIFFVLIYDYFDIN